MGGGRNWEIGTDIYTLLILCIKWMTNKNLLYKKINKIKFKNSKKKKRKMTTILYPAKLSIRTEGRIKTFPNKQKLREFITTRSALQEMLTVVL